MARLLFVVEDTFAIRGRGLVIVPGIVQRADEVFRVGDPLRLKRPDGTELLTAVGGLEMFMSPVPGEEIPILLRELGKEDIPVGSEVWSVDQA
jgi:translation elongation factor EF-Tu-like GTPase